MNSLTFAQIEVGMQGKFEVTVTEEMQEQFLAITDDINPMHSRDSFAIERGFAGRLVYGMLVASFFSTLAGVYLPGANCLLHSVESSFVRPVYIGDSLTITGIVKEKHDIGNQLIIKAKIKNQNDVLVSRATIKAGCLI